MRHIWGRVYNYFYSVQSFQEHTSLHHWEIWNYPDSTYGWPSDQTEQLGKKDLGHGGEEPNDHSDRTTEFLGWDGRTCQKDNSLYSTSPIWAFWESGQTEGTTECLEFAKWQEKEIDHKVKDSVVWDTNLALWPEWKALCLEKTRHSSSPI